MATKKPKIVLKCIFTRNVRNENYDKTNLCKRKKKCKIETFAKTEFLKRIDFNESWTTIKNLNFSNSFLK